MWCDFDPSVAAVAIGKAIMVCIVIDMCCIFLFWIGVDGGHGWVAVLGIACRGSEGIIGSISSGTECCVEVYSQCVQWNIETSPDAFETFQTMEDSMHRSAISDCYDSVLEDCRLFHGRVWILAPFLSIQDFQCSGAGVGLCWGIIHTSPCFCDDCRAVKPLIFKCICERTWPSTSASIGRYCWFKGGIIGLNIALLLYYPFLSVISWLIQQILTCKGQTIVKHLGVIRVNINNPIIFGAPHIPNLHCGLNRRLPGLRLSD